MEGIIVVFALVFLVLAIIGLTKENKILAKYSGVFGRVKAYFFMGGVLMLPVVIIMAIMGQLSKNALTMIGGAVAWAAIAVFIAITTKKNCPPQLQKGLLLSMFWAGIGITMKICLFFLPFIWKIGAPSDTGGGDMPGYARDDNGNSCPISQQANGEYYIRRANGSESPVRKAGNQLIDSDGNYYYYQ